MTKMKRAWAQPQWLNDSGKRTPKHHPAQGPVIDRLGLAGVPSSVQFSNGDMQFSVTGDLMCWARATSSYPSRFPCGGMQEI